MTSRCSHFTDVCTESEVQDLRRSLLGSTPGLFPLYCQSLGKLGGGMLALGVVPGPDPFLGNWFPENTCNLMRKGCRAGGSRVVGARPGWGVGSVSIRHEQMSWGSILGLHEVFSGLEQLEERP